MLMGGGLNGQVISGLLPSALDRNAASQAIASLPEVGLAPGELFSVEESLLTPVDVTKAKITIRLPASSLSACSSFPSMDSTLLRAYRQILPRDQSTFSSRMMALP